MANPYNYGKPVPVAKFAGVKRLKQVEDVCGDLLNPDGPSHVIIGGRRFGKSSFLLKLQEMLIKALADGEQSGWYVFPVLVSLKSLQCDSAAGVFGLMLSTLERYLYSPFYRRELTIPLKLQEKPDCLSSFMQKEVRECTFDEFMYIIEHVLDVFLKEHGMMCIVFLIDETEEILERSWTEDIFNNFRSLIYIGPLARYVRCVLTGSSKIIEVRQRGSQLLNMLKEVYLEALSDEDITSIVGWTEAVPQDIVHRVQQESGGHSFIAQYLLHFSYEKMTNGAEVELSNLIDQFYRQRYGDLEQWKNDLEMAGLVAYSILAEAKSWLTEIEVKKRVTDRVLQAKIGLALLNLCYHGFAIYNKTLGKYHIHGELFKNWFVKDVLPSLDVAPFLTETLPADKNFTRVDPQITVRFMNNRIFPTWRGHLLTRDTFPFVTVEVDNRGENRTNVKITVEATIQGFSEVTEETVIIDSDQVKEIYLLPRPRTLAVKILTEKSRQSCLIRVKRHTETGLVILDSHDEDIEVYPFDTALLATWTAEGHLQEDQADDLAVFVTPHHRNVENLVGLAARRLKGGMPGYQGAETVVNGKVMVDLEKARGLVQAQARALFLMLKNDVKLVYTNALENFGKQPGQTSQRVRPPYISLDSEQRQVQANCLEGAVLFASLLENVGIRPIIVLVPSHAFVGWYIWPDVKRYEFLETTMIPTHSFEDALRAGTAHYEWGIQRGDNQRPLFHPDGFLRCVDIYECHHNKKIEPIPFL